MISLIVAYDNNRCIGKENGIPWKMKSDMHRVKSLTTNQTILMGRKTFESIGRPLPNRINRVLTRSLDFDNLGIEVYRNFEDAIEYVETEKIFIFGGSQIYNQYLQKVDEMFITEIDTYTEGDSYFPEIDMREWEVILEEKHKKDLENEYDYKFIHLKRI